MDCNKIEEKYLIAYLFDEADEEERKIVEAHLETCSKCKATLSELRETVTTMHRLKDEDIPHRVVLLRESTTAGRGRFVAPLWLRGLGWAAAAAVLVLVVSQGSVHYGDGALTVSFGRSAKPQIAQTAKEGQIATSGEEPQFAHRTEGGRSTMAPTETMLPTSDSSSSTPQRTGPASQTQPEVAYASMQDLERANAQNMALIQQLFTASEDQRNEQWKETVAYLIGAITDQRQRDMNELMMRIDAMGAGTLSEIDMTNRRVDELAQNVMGAGTQPTQQSGQTPVPARRRPDDKD
jgi:hypothetical protein